MSEREIRKRVAELILEIEKPFNISDLLYSCTEEGICDDELVLEVLEELCENGTVDYSEIEDDCWAFSPVRC